MIETPEIMQAEERHAAVIRISILRHEIHGVMEPAFREIYETILEQRLNLAGSRFTRHLHVDAERFEFEAGVPVEQPVTPAGRVQAGQLPGGRVARALYTGEYENLGQAWSELNGWLASQGEQAGGDRWAVYEHGPEHNPEPATWRTVLYRTLAG